MRSKSSRTRPFPSLSHAALALAIAFALPMQVASAQSASVVEAISEYDIPAGDLASSLGMFSKQSGLQLVYRQELASGKRAPAVKGNLSWRQVLDALLRDSGLEWDNANESTIVIRQKSAPDNAPKPDNPAPATTSAQQRPEPVKEMERMTVVGSRLGVHPSDSALPVKVISREEIERTGASSIAQVLRYLPEVSVSNAPSGNIGMAGGFLGSTVNATSVQLRGLPLGTTLILIDGRRSGTTSSFAASGLFDLSTIPLAMVDRIEVLPAGASAVYGGDGLAGVINIVLRKDVEAAEIRFRNISADGYSEQHVTGTWGKSWSRGSLTLMATLAKNGDLTSEERALTADQDFRRFGGKDRRSAFSSYPATIYSLAGCPSESQYCFVPLDQRANLPGLDSPFASVPLDQDGTSLAPGDFVGGEINSGDRLIKFRTAEKTYSVSLNGRLQASSGVEVFADVFFSKRELPAQEIRLEIGLGELGGSVVSAENPFNPFGVDVGIDYYFPKTGFFASYSQSHQRMAIGARGDWRDLEWEFSASKARDRSSFDGGGTFYPDLVAEALASSDPQTALNVFTGDGSAPGSRALLQSLLVPIDLTYGSDIDNLTGFVRGTPWSLPAGDIYALVGADYQKVTLKSSDKGAARTGGEDTSRAVFAEVRAPILSTGNASDKRKLMVLTGAFRHERTDRSEESANTSTLGIEIRPTTSILIRGTHSTAFKPIIAYTAFQETMPLPFGLPVRDPKFDGRQFLVNPVIGGGVPPGLRPETSSNSTFGFVWTPNDSFRTSVTAWRTHIDDKFLFLSLSGDDMQFIVDNESSYPKRVIRDSQTGFITDLDMRQINVSSTTLTGADISIEGRMFTSKGEVVGSLGATYTHSYDVRRLEDSPVESRVAVLGTTGWAPRWKIVPRLTWHSDNLTSASIAGRYISSYKDTLPLLSGPGAGQVSTLGDFWIIDLTFNIGLDRLLADRLPWVENARFRISVNNIANKLPDFCNSCTRGYDATQYSLFGRSISTELVLGL